MPPRVFDPLMSDHGVAATFASKPIIQVEQRFDAKDDWTGLASSKERRKLQNRLNQRLYRTRHGVKSTTAGKRRVRLDADFKSGASSSLSSGSDVPDGTERIISVRNQDRPLRSGTLCNLSHSDRQRLIAHFNDSIRQNAAAASPRLDMLLTLVHFNVFRALFSNAVSMGFDTGWLTGEAVSPFHTSGSGTSSVQCPPHLQPTTLQRTVDHHPWIDLFPFPAMRDNLLRADGEYDEDQLCIDLVEFCHVPHEQTGLIVWGEPVDPKGWEVSEAFLRKWRWVLDGCREVQQSTNYWRRQRGEEALVWEL